MATPRVFISSTVYDLDEIRERVASFIKSLGYEPVRNEKGDIPYGKEKELTEYCYQAVRDVDFLVGIIGFRYGFPSEDAVHSITQREILTALDLRKLTYVFIRDSVETEFRTYQQNKDTGAFRPSHTDSIKVFEFMEGIKNRKDPPVIHSFRSSEDILQFLSRQLAGNYKRLIDESSRPALTSTRYPELSESILHELKNLDDRKEYSTILRYKTLFSDLLWQKGRMQERIRLADYAEKAAISTDNVRLLIEILVDDKGWSLVSLGKAEYKRARSTISHGLEKARTATPPYHYYVAKALRHLAGIDFEEGKLNEAEDKLKEAEATAIRLTSNKQNRILFGTNVALAKVKIAQDNFPEAQKHLDHAEKLALIADDELKLVSLISIRGKMQELMGSLEEAKETYMKGASRAESMNFFDEMLRNYSGLISVFRKEGVPSKVAEFIAKSHALLDQSQITYEVGDGLFEISKLIRDKQRFLTLVRHGVSIKNNNRIIGGSGAPLDTNAYADLDALCARIVASKVKHDIIICSPRPQCIETAEYMAKRIHTPVRVDESIAPAHMGVVDGLSDEEVKAKFSEIGDRLNSWRLGEIEGWELNIPEMEDINIFFERGRTFMDMVLSNYHSSLIVGTSSIMILIANILLGHKIQPKGNYRSIAWANQDYLTFIKNNGSLKVYDPLTSVRIAK